jgi:pyruvate/2-oxoglutarate dehydrogenase complex dihydrolipoamide acyltransferase (E2) component
MFVNTMMLHSGAAESHRAGSHADDGANHLARKSPVPGMFGDFATAAAFHEAVTQARTQHTAKLRAHQQTLSNVGDKARTVAAAFTEMDERNASKLKAVRCTSAT